MRYALILAGGSGTRLWPMSRVDLPKQLIPFIGGRSLLQVAADRLVGFLPSDAVYVCASDRHQAGILGALPQLTEDRYLGEPTGRDTLNAVALGTGLIGRKDPDAVVAIFTADHLIRPVDQFQAIVEQGFALAEQHPETLVTFGIAPTEAAIGYGYLELGDSLGASARVVRQFREKPVVELAEEYVAAGPDRYLWNSGMFVWRASTLMDCVRRYEPESFAGIEGIVESWDTPNRTAVMRATYPTLRKISIDFAVMEPASRDPKVRVAALPMALDWLDVGSWPMFAQTCEKDEHGNSLAAEHLLLETSNTLVASSDPTHLITTIGCEDLIIIHTTDTTLVCRADRAEAIKELHRQVEERYGAEKL